MNMRLIDSSWSALGHTNGQGLATAKAKLEQVRQMHSVIAADQDRDVANGVLADGLLERALERCVQIHKGEGELDNTDLEIFFRYADKAAKEAEAMLEKELPHLIADNQA